MLTLRDCVALNAPPDPPTDPSADPSGGANEGVEEEGLFDPEDADECDDLDDFFGAPSSAPGAGENASGSLRWDYVSRAHAFCCEIQLRV